LAIGKLYIVSSGEEQLVGDVNYKFHDESLTSWWGELTLIEYKRLKDGGGYVIELEDSRKGRCYLKKRVNRAVSGIPPRYIYHFSGNSPLKRYTA